MKSVCASLFVFIVASFNGLSSIAQSQIQASNFLPNYQTGTDRLRWKPKQDVLSATSSARKITDDKTEEFKRLNQIQSTMSKAEAKHQLGTLLFNNVTSVATSSSEEKPTSEPPFIIFITFLCLAYFLCCGFCVEAVFRYHAHNKHMESIKYNRESKRFADKDQHTSGGVVNKEIESDSTLTAISVLSGGCDRDSVAQAIGEMAVLYRSYSIKKEIDFSEDV